MSAPTLFQEDLAPVRPIEADVKDDSPDWFGSAVVWGPAVSQGSKRGFIHPKLKRVVIVDDNAKELQSWRQELIKVMRRVRPAHPLDRPIAVHILIYVTRPQGHYGTGKNAGELKASAPRLPGSGKDIDKVCRAIFDAGKIAGWYFDDARICDLRVRRRYQSGLGERTWVWAWTLDRADQPRPELLEEEPEATAPPDPIAPPKRRGAREDYVDPDVNY